MRLLTKCKVPLTLGCALVFSSLNVFGALANCPTQGGEPVESLSTISVRGCQITDLQFNNYTVNSGSGLPTASTLDMTASTAGTVNGVDSIEGLSATYAPTALGGFVTPNDQAYNSQFDGLVTVDSGFTPQDKSPNNFGIVDLSLAYGTVTLLDKTGTEPSITLTENFCLGGTTTPTGGAALACSSSTDEGSITIKLTATGIDGTVFSAVDTCALGGYNGAGTAVGCTVSGTDATIGFANLGKFTTIATQTIVEINDNTGLPEGVTSLTEDFGQVGAPEPSTLLLLGSALAGLIIRTRRKGCARR
jgi:PEP-CTERM motif